MKKNIFPLIFISIFSIISTFSQKINHASLLIPSELKEDANAVIRDNAIEITIDAIDEMVVRRRKVITILNKSGNADASIGESYNNDTKITKLSAIIYDGLGKQLKKYSKGKFLDVSAVSGGTLYSDARVKYVRYVPTTYPYTIVFESEYKTSSTGFVPSWFPTNGYFVAIEKSQYKLNNPLNIGFRTKKQHFKEYPIKDFSTDTDVHFVFENQKAIKPENASIASRDFMPSLKVSLNNFALKKVKGSGENWQVFGKWMYDNLLVGRDGLDTATELKVKSLVAGVDDPIEKAKIVYQFMQDRTRYISVQVGIGGWEPIAAHQVDKVGYGDCKGLTNYTKALLDVVGVTSYYTVVYAQEKRDIDKEFSSLQGNHVILNIPNNGNDVWLECTSQTIPFGFLGDFTDDRNVLVITPEGGVIKRTPAYKNEKNSQITKASIQLDAAGSVSATLERESKGLQFDDKSYYDRYSEEELIKEYKSEVWSYNNNLEIVSIALQKDKENIVFTEKLDIYIKNYASINAQEYLFRVNVFDRNSFVPKRYRKRTLPLKIGRGYKDVAEYEITIPKEYILGVMPPEKELSTKFGSYKVHFTKIDDTTFRYKKVMIIKEGVFPKEDYKLYRSFRRSIAKQEGIRIAIKKK